jgi:hypothetical protein
MPKPPASVGIALTCSDIATQIAASGRGSCDRSTVWRVIKRLKIEPTIKAGRYSLYSAEDAKKIAATIRPQTADTADK